MKRIPALDKPRVPVAPQIAICGKCLDTGWLEGNYREADFCDCEAGRKYRKEWEARNP